MTRTTGSRTTSGRARAVVAAALVALAAASAPGPAAARTAGPAPWSDRVAEGRSGRLGAGDVEPLAELTMAMGLSPRPSIAGRPTRVVVSFGNVGEAPAADVVVTVSGPTGWTLELPPDGQPGCAPAVPGPTVVCEVDEIAPEDAVTVVALLTPPAGAAAVGLVRAEGVTSSPQAGWASDVASEEVTSLVAGADLVAGPATVEPSAPAVGESATLRWRFRNASTGRVALDPTFSTVLPPGFSPWGVLGGESLFCSYDEPSRRGTCVANRGVLLPGEEVTIVLPGTFDAPGRYAVTATATQSSPEVSPGDESAVAEAVVTDPRADLVVTASPASGAATVGEAYAYVVLVTDQGPQTAQGASLAATVPAGLEVVSARRGWFGVRCRSLAPLRCDLPALAPSGVNFVVVTVRPVAPGTTVTRWTAAATTPDPDPSSNAASVTIEARSPEPGRPPT